MPDFAKRPTAIVADDHAEIHPLISRILKPEMDVVSNVFDGQALLNAAEELRPELVIVDLFMPVLDGLEAVRRLREHSPRVAVVFMSTDAREENVQRAFAAGATAFINKASAAEHLLPAARSALKGEVFVV